MYEIRQPSQSTRVRGFCRPASKLAVAIKGGLFGIAACTAPLTAFAQSAEPMKQPATLPKVSVEADVPTYKAETTSTATRTDTPLRDVPQSVTVITRQLIDDQNMQNIADVVNITHAMQAELIQQLIQDAGDVGVGLDAFSLVAGG